MRLYHLSRKEDVSGTSGTGHVAEVVEFDDGAVVVRWMDDRNASGVASTTMFNSLDDLLKVHGHQGKTGVELVVDAKQALELERTARRLRESLRQCINSMKAHGIATPTEVQNILDLPTLPAHEPQEQ